MAATLLIPAVLFLTPGAASNSYRHHGRVNNPSLEYPFSEIFFLDHENRKNKRMFDSLENDGIDEVLREIEVDHLDQDFQRARKQIHRLPLHEWLNDKEKCSTIFVSFESECYLFNEEIEELAPRLELSMVNFIWSCPCNMINHLVNEVRVRLEIHRDEERNIGKEEVVKIVKQVLLAQSGERLREKAKEFSEIMRANGENDIDKVVEELLNLCKETIRHRYNLG
ncbi:hypothetical protein RND71_022009 [Anisodus tanguticus]|uniref:Uncharacterized protein n=1 Tax=Anisodus tanguticus TaxID=243964 RepID=A0AAE1RXM1_9SOLA|nr:hypothetical protein RND71_022009 [Anisodus tanguticus]